jgi:hypothetical protein
MIRKKPKINIDKRRQQIRKKILIFRGIVFQILEISGIYVSLQDVLKLNELRVILDELFLEDKKEFDRKKSFFERLFPKKSKNEKVIVLEFRCQYIYTQAIVEIAKICNYANQYYNEKTHNILIIWYYLDEKESYELTEGQVIKEATQIPVIFVKIEPPNTKFTEKANTAIGANFHLLYKKHG